MELCGTGGEDGCRDNNTGDADELVHGVCGQVTELLEVEARLNENLDVGYGLLRIVGVTGEREEDGPCCLCSCSLKLDAHVK